jgi:hypothetical protein
VLSARTQTKLQLRSCCINGDYPVLPIPNTKSARLSFLVEEDLPWWHAHKIFLVSLVRYWRQLEQSDCLWHISPERLSFQSLCAAVVGPAQTSAFPLHQWLILDDTPLNSASLDPSVLSAR